MLLAQCVQLEEHVAPEGVRFSSDVKLTKTRIVLVAMGIGAVPEKL